MKVLRTCLVLALLIMAALPSVHAESLLDQLLKTATPCPAVCKNTQPKDMDRAIEEIFGQSVPVGFSAMCGGPVARVKDKGTFLLMSMPARRTMAIVVKVHDLEKNDPLLDYNRVRLSHHLFDNYIFMRDGYQAKEVGKVGITGKNGHAEASRLVVSFSDKFVEPDLIGVVDNLKGAKKGSHERLIIMLGQPDAGDYGSTSTFFANFRTMEGVMKQMLGIPKDPAASE